MITMPRMITGQPCSCKIHAINYFQYVICSRPAPIGTTIYPSKAVLHHTTYIFGNQLKIIYLIAIITN